MIVVPQEFADWRTWQSGTDGQRWIDSLPELVERLCARWRLELTDEAPMYGANGLVLPATRAGDLGDAGQPCVLKVSWPDPTSVREAEALRLWDGRGTVRLLDASPDEGGLLLERLDTRRSLRDLPLLEAAELAGALARSLTVPAPAPLGFDRLTDIAAGMADSWSERRHRANSAPVPERWLDLATSLSRELAVDAGSDLVHADLHYGNVLAGVREPWLAIDPKPVAGEPEYCVPELMWTRLDEAADDTEVRRLLAALVDAGGLDARRARAWVIVRAIDYWLWGLDAGLTEDPVRCRRLVETLVV